MLWVLVERNIYLLCIRWVLILIFAIDSQIKILVKYIYAWNTSTQNKLRQISSYWYSIPVDTISQLCRIEQITFSPKESCDETCFKDKILLLLMKVKGHILSSQYTFYTWKEWRMSKQTE